MDYLELVERLDSLEEADPNISRLHLCEWPFLFLQVAVHVNTAGDVFCDDVVA